MTAASVEEYEREYDAATHVYACYVTPTGIAIGAGSLLFASE